MKTIRNCLICNKEFNIKSSSIKKGRGKFCSIKCKGLWQSENQKGKNNPNWNNGLIKQICQICKNDFFVIPSKINQRKCCSGKCMGMWRSKNLLGKNNPTWKGIKHICKTCGGEKYFTPSQIKRGDGKFCSMKCKGIWQKKNVIGKNHPSWKGGITPILLRIRASDKYKQWHQSCFIRDNFTCQDCRQIGGDLEVHHKKTFYKLIEEVKKYLPLLDLYEAAMLYTPLWSIDNGITCCKKCHKKYKKGR